jgi:thymidylate kinase
MPFIAFLGCDGSGKSAVIQGLAARLVADGHKVTYGHWRPKPFAASGVYSSSATNDPHGQVPRGFASSILKLAWLWFNWWVAWLKFLRRNSRNDYVLFDRYHGDLLVDPKRYRYGGPMWLAKLASRLMPKPDKVIFLDADPDILLSRKQEVSREALVRSRVNYEAAGNFLTNFTKVDASAPLPAVVAQVLKEIA